MPPESDTAIAPPNPSCSASRRPRSGSTGSGRGTKHQHRHEVVAGRGREDRDAHRQRHRGGPRIDEGGQRRDHCEGRGRKMRSSPPGARRPHEDLAPNSRAMSTAPIASDLRAQCPNFSMKKVAMSPGVPRTAAPATAVGGNSDRVGDPGRRPRAIASATQVPAKPARRMSRRSRGSSIAGPSSAGFGRLGVRPVQPLSAGRAAKDGKAQPAGARPASGGSVGRILLGEVDVGPDRGAGRRPPRTPRSERSRSLPSMTRPASSPSTRGIE